MAGSLDVNGTDVTYGNIVGQASLGAVYMAKHKAWGPVWVRRMDVTTTITQASSTGRRLMKEAEVLKFLHHKNIVQMMGIIWNSPTKNYAIVFEPARYGFLSDFLQLEKNREIPIKVKVAFMYDIALGLSYLHSAKIIHRDLRWQNIQVSDHLVLKIADFGLAEWVTYSRSHSSGRYYQGPTYHIPPESWRDINLRPNEKTDIYSYAILCWTIAAQEEPFKYAETEQIRDAVMRGQHPSHDSLPADSPPELWQWLQSWWHNSPEERPPLPGHLSNTDLIPDTDCQFHTIQEAAVILAQLEEFVGINDKAIEDAKVQLIISNRHDGDNDLDIDYGEDHPSVRIETLGSSDVENITKATNDLSGSDFGSKRKPGNISACATLSQDSESKFTQDEDCDLETDADESPENINSTSNYATSAGGCQHTHSSLPVQNMISDRYSPNMSSCTSAPKRETIPSKETGTGSSEQCIGAQSGLNSLNNFMPTSQEQDNSSNRIKVHERSDNKQKTKKYTFSGVDNIQIGDKNVMHIRTSSSVSAGSCVTTPKKTKEKKFTITSSKKQLDERNMDMLKKELGKDWKSLARKLGFCEGEIDAFEHDNQGLSEQVYKFLRQWIDKKDCDATLCAVADALIDIKKYEIAAKLKDN